ncbi:MAG TPA: hypothetical protein VIM11_16715 [Tepidisphaeraceae bacterium]|jgi:hypothetical protein
MSFVRYAVERSFGSSIIEVKSGESELQPSKTPGGFQRFQNATGINRVDVRGRRTIRERLPHGEHISTRNRREENERQLRGGHTIILLNKA